MKVKRLIAVAAATMMLTVLAAPAGAEVTFDAETGTGFVGKGDVQLAFGFNNKAMNDNAEGVEFSVTAVSETTWECQNTNNQKLQERSQTTTTAGLVKHVARDNKNKQITGFNLSGYSGGSSTTTEGNPLNSCPNSNGTWVLVEGSSSTTDGEGSEVSATYDGVTVTL